MAMSTAIVASVVAAHALPAEWTDPVDGKKAMTGKKGASKQDMMKAAVKRYPSCAKSFKLKRGSKTVYENRFEHTADAIAAFVTAKEGTLVRLLHKQ
jgi:hypothetical protein